VGTLLRYSPSLFRTPICCTVITRNKNCNKATKIGNWNKINQQFQLNNALFLSIFIFCFLATIWEIRVFLSERATQYSCHFHKPVPFCVLTSTSIENARSHKYAVTNKRTSRVNIVIRGYHSIRWHQNIWRYLVGMFFDLAFLKVNDAIYALVVYTCSCNVKNKWLPYPCWILPSVRKVVLNISF